MGVLCFFPSRVMRSPHKALLRCALEKNTRAPGLEMLKGPRHFQTWFLGGRQRAPLQGLSR